jgi:hypothetical protein
MLTAHRLGCPETVDRHGPSTKTTFRVGSSSLPPVPWRASIDASNLQPVNVRQRRNSIDAPCYKQEQQFVEVVTELQ